MCVEERVCETGGVSREFPSSDNYDRYSKKEFLFAHRRREPKVGVSKLWPTMGQVLSLT